jgi:opacity protein-like surface antigen
MKKLIFALIASAAAMTAAQAQTTAPRPYIGIGAATADHDYSLSGRGASNVNSDGYKTSAKIFGGVELDQRYGVEAGYTDFRKSDFSYTAPNGAAGRGQSDGYGVYVAGKATAPINDQLSAYGKLGVAYSKRKLSSNTGMNMENNDTGVYAGVGLQYNINQQVALTAEYERYGKSKDFGAKADVWTVGAKYSF